MAYGKFTNLNSKYYSKATYTIDETSYTGIHTFITDPSTQSIEQAIYLTGDKQRLAAMNPPGVEPSKLVAKTNSCAFQSYGAGGTSFYGFNYVNGECYFDGAKLSGVDDRVLVEYLDGDTVKQYPSFCIKTDGTATIRWCNASRLKVAIPYCKTIIAGCHALVYDSKSVFEYVVKDAVDDGIRIADWNNLDSSSYHHNHIIGNGVEKSKTNRTLLGHKPDGAFILVCTWSGMDLRVAAKMMADFGCDYAVNQDGSAAIRMRAATGYTNGFKSGQMCGNSEGGNQDYYGAATCVYLK